MLEIEGLVNQGLLRFDLEFGNSHGFFSASKHFSSFYEGNKVPGNTSYLAKIKSAEITIEDSVGSDGESIFRSSVFKIKSASRLFDMVSRFVVIDSSAGRDAVIDGHRIAHRSSNLYHQYPACRVRVPVSENGWLEFEGAQEGMPREGFEHVFYVRDQGQTELGKIWVVHHRIVATVDAGALILRGCNPRFEGPAPQWVNSCMPPMVKNYLFRIREKKHPNFPIMVVGENEVPAGNAVTLNTKVVLQ